VEFLSSGDVVMVVRLSSNPSPILPTLFAWVLLKLLPSSIAAVIPKLESRLMGKVLHSFEMISSRDATAVGDIEIDVAIAVVIAVKNAATAIWICIVGATLTLVLLRTMAVAIVTVAAGCGLSYEFGVVTIRLLCWK
jgi:hypothetical protein